MTNISTAISDADLHGLVDGRLDLSRRADVLRLLAKAPGDRARLEAWQDQTDLLRSAFGSVQREPLPATLDLLPKPRLRCVSHESVPIVARPVVSSKPPSRPARRSLVAGLGFVIAFLVGYGWSMVSISVPVARNSGLRPRGSIDEALSARTIAALGDMPKASADLPTLPIPDLTTAGFTFVGAETEQSRPACLLFRYRSASAESLVISVARSAVAPSRSAVRMGDAYVWRSRDTTFAMAGTIGPDRLKTIATALQSDDAR